MTRHLATLSIKVHCYNHNHTNNNNIILVLLVFSIITTVQPLHCGCYCCTHSFYRSGMARTLSKVVVVNKQLCPHLTVLYDGYKQVLHNTVARHEITLLLSQVLHIIINRTHYSLSRLPRTRLCCCWLPTNYNQIN